MLRFHQVGRQQIALALPDADQDYLQRVILLTRNFYEAKLLALVGDTGLIGPDKVVFDVGANTGNHSVYFGRVLGARRVISFELQPHCFETLRRNLGLNGLDPGDARNVMVGATPGAGAITGFNPRNLGGTSFAPSADGDVPMIALDDIAADVTPDFIKIDVEGMQLEVLRRASKLIARRRPPIWVEILERDGQFDATAGFLSLHGYRPRRLAQNDWLFVAG